MLTKSIYKDFLAYHSRKEKGQFSSVAQSCLTLCDPMNCSTPGLPVHHQLPEFTQTHVHRVSHVIQPSHPLPSLSPAFNLSQNHGLFRWISLFYHVVKVLEFQLQYQSLQWTPSSVQLLSCVRLFATPWITACQACLSITNSQSSPKLISIESLMPSSHHILCCPLLLLPPIPPRIRVFASESTLHMRWPKYWSFSFSIIPSKEHPGLIGSPCSPRDSQESSPTPQFKSINSLVLSSLHSPTLTSIHDHCKNHSLD